jgi:hypothetical protein
MVRAFGFVLSFVLAASLAARAQAQTQAPPPSQAQAATTPPRLDTDAHEHLVRAKHAAATGQWEVAAQEYVRANAINPSSEAAEGIAKARDALHDSVAAYLAFAALLNDYPRGLSPRLQRYAKARLSALSRSTGTVTVTVDEPGARIAVDDQDEGASPLPAPIRATMGTHRLKAAKEGFRDAAVQVVVAGGSDVPVTMSLVPEARTGHVVVTETSGRPIDVLIDGVDRGAAPWEGEVDAGPHEILGRSATLLAPPRTFVVARGTRNDVLLTASPLVAHVKIVANEAKAFVTVDGHIVGEGQFEGDVPIGPHLVRVALDGYEELDKRVVLAVDQPYTENVSLSPITTVGGEPTGESPLMRGAYGGLLGHFSVQPGGFGGDLSPPCGAAVGRCSAGTPLGAGLLGYVGYMAGPIGFDVLFGAQADSVNAHVVVNGSSSTMAIPRAGGIGAVRARLGWQSNAVRLTLAAGVGMAVRAVRLVQGGNVFDLVSGDSGETAYVAPAVTLEGALHLRASSDLAVSLGLLFWGENVGSSIQVQASPFAGPVRPISGLQTLLCPFLGLEFGP